MPSRNFDATTTPRNIVSVLSLAVRKRYTCQNVSGTSTLFFREAAAQPEPTDRAFRIEPGGFFTLEPQGDPLWFWTDEAAGCAVVVNEAV